MSRSTSFIIAPGGRLRGRLCVPGDKSISHRAVMLACVANGDTEISGFLEAEDTLATLAAFRAMGVKVNGPEDGRVAVRGVGLRGLRAPEGPLYLGNSGTSMRLLAGLLAGQSFRSTLTGDASLSRRPMRRITEPLTLMGARIAASDLGRPPLEIRPAEGLAGIDYTMPVASAQVKSCVLLAALYAEGRTCVREPAPTRDHTERMLATFGYPVEQVPGQVCLAGGGMLRGTALKVPGDLSSAAFFLVGAIIASGSDLLLENVGINPTRTGIINILRMMGANIDVFDEHMSGGEPVAHVSVRSSRLTGIEIPADQVPLAIDEFPALFVAAACSEGVTRVVGAEELKVKESDRLHVMAEGLQALGVDARPTSDGMIIRGGPISGGRVASHGDHRVAMAFAVAGLRASDEIAIDDCAGVNTSFPGFDALARKAGLKIRTHGA